MQGYKDNRPTTIPHKREALRNKGQFWTPLWVARGMVEYAIKTSRLLFDPAFGQGAFFAALEERGHNTGEIFDCYGLDIDQTLINDSYLNFSSSLNRLRLENRDFIKNPPLSKFQSIVANPPYIRHHRLTENQKTTNRCLSKFTLGFTLDGRAGIHIYFLIQALRLLEKNGNLCFIMPADTCEGIFSKPLWDWITENYRLECVITFSPDATPFPGVDTNPIIFCIKNALPENRIHWVRVKFPTENELLGYIASDFTDNNYSSLEIFERTLKEALNVGLSRPPSNRPDTKYRLYDFATTMRGIATGNNQFFFLTNDKVQKLGIPQRYFRKAIGRTRDVEGNTITEETLRTLEDLSQPTNLLYLDATPVKELPSVLQKYIAEGEKMGLHEKSLISSRHPWYKMEKRDNPPILFSYLGRRNSRFIRNYAGILPLTGFLCVYPRINEHQYLDSLWNVLNHEETLYNLKSVGKSYGSGAIKIEPRALEKLPIPDHLIVNIEPKRLL